MPQLKNMMKLNKKFIDAYRDGDVYLVDYILNYDYDVCLDSYNEHLEFVSKYGKEMLDLIQSAYVDLRYCNESSLKIACAKGHINIVKSLIYHYQKGYEYMDDSVMLAAIKSNNSEIVKIVLKQFLTRDYSDFLRSGGEFIEKAYELKNQKILSILIEAVKSAHEKQLLNVMEELDPLIVSIVRPAHTNILDSVYNNLTQLPSDGDEEIINYISQHNL
jgi:hypothetical protein